MRDEQARLQIIRRKTVAWVSFPAHWRSQSLALNIIGSQAQPRWANKRGWQDGDAFIIRIEAGEVDAAMHIDAWIIRRGKALNNACSGLIIRAGFPPC